MLLSQPSCDKLLPSVLPQKHPAVQPDCKMTQHCLVSSVQEQLGAVSVSFAVLPKGVEFELMGRLLVRVPK